MERERERIEFESSSGIVKCIVRRFGIWWPGVKKYKGAGGYALLVDEVKFLVQS